MPSAGVRITLLRAAGLRPTSRSLLSNAVRAKACLMNRELMDGRDKDMGRFLRDSPAGITRVVPRETAGRRLCAQAGAPRAQGAVGIPDERQEEDAVVDGKMVDDVAGDAMGDSVDDAPVEASETAEKQPRMSEKLEISDAELEVMHRWLHERLGLSEQRAVTVARSSKWMWDRDVEKDFEPKLRWLMQWMDLASEQEVLQLVADNLLLLRLDIDELEASMEDLRKLLQVNAATMTKMVASCPRILLVPLAEATQKIKWLEERLLLSGGSAMRVVINRPMLIAMSIEGRLEPTVEWAERELRLDPQQVGILTLKYPKWMFAITRNGLELRLRWLQTALGCTKDQAVRMMSRDGRLWFLGRKNLWPKIVFFREDLGVPQASLRDAVVKCPMIIASNLKTRMRPRVARMNEAGISFDFDEHQRVISLASDESFEKWLAEAQEAKATAETST